MEIPINKLKLTSQEKIIPDLSNRDFNKLKESIEKWGIIEPIIINQHNVIICGKERYRAALVLGIAKVPVVIRKTNGDGEIKDISLEENLKRRHLDSSSIKTKEIKDFYESKQIKKEGKRGRKKRKYTSSREVIDQVDKSERHFSRCRLSAKLIPELSKLLDAGKINGKSASAYAKVSLENQKKLYGILMDNFTKGSSLKTKKMLVLLKGNHYERENPDSR